MFICDLYLWPSILCALPTVFYHFTRMFKWDSSLRDKEVRFPFGSSVCGPRAGSTRLRSWSSGPVAAMSFWRDSVANSTVCGSSVAFLFWWAICPCVVWLFALLLIPALLYFSDVYLHVGSRPIGILRDYPLWFSALHARFSEANLSFGVHWSGRCHSTAGSVSRCPLLRSLDRSCGAAHYF